MEVHHSETQVSQMERGHKTSLDSLQCLCANCHRLVHRQLKGA
ncbi:HNH endonuclease [Pseudoduganella sp. OTU4001]